MRNLQKLLLKHLFERFYEGEYRKFHTIGKDTGLSLIKDDNNDIIDDDIPSIQDDDMASKESGVGLPVILLVEDNDAQLDLLLQLINRRYKVVTARNGREALEVIRKQAINIILSEVTMPEMDGIDLCRQVKITFETCHIPLILLTAKTSSEERVTGYESGADDYFCKPVKLSVLFARIDNLLKKQKQFGIDLRKQLVFEAKELNYNSMDEKFIQKAVDYINKHMNDFHFDHAKFIEEMGMSRTKLTDKLKLLTQLTPSGFINNLRLQAAIRLIEKEKKIRISDLAFAVGFNDPKYFSSCFKKKFGLTPTGYMEKFDR